MILLKIEIKLSKHFPIQIYCAKNIKIKFMPLCSIHKLSYLHFMISTVHKTYFDVHKSLTKHAAMYKKKNVKKKLKIEYGRSKSLIMTDNISF